MMINFGIPALVMALFIAVCVMISVHVMPDLKPVSVIAQNEITILRKAERAIDSLSDDYAGTLSDSYIELQYEKGKALAILAIAEQLKRIADALEER